ncbi:MAG: PAS domain S-box protein, partial [Anaerolineales bacterium]|nr:PAS domain S-box protein [Anaerolineales bacterium]
MSLRKKTVLLILTTNLILVAVLYGVFAQNWFQTILNFERSAIQRDLDRVAGTLNHELDTLSAVVADWSIWDDTYQFVQDGNQDYIQTNLHPSTFNSLKLNLVAIVSLDGKVVYINFFDTKIGKFIEPPAEVLAHLSPSSVLLAHKDIHSEIKGFLPLNNHYLFVASRPILKSSYQGPIRGALIFGRLVDDEIESSLAQQTQTSLRLIPLNQASADPELAEIISRLKVNLSQYRSGADPSAPNYLLISQQAVEGYLLLEDIYHQPALLVAVHRPRPIFQAALSGILTSALILLLTAVFLSLLMARSLDQVVLRPLAQLRAAIHQISSQHDLSLRLPTNETDEVGQLAADFNEMLESLAQSKAALQHAQAELLEKTTQLAEMNQTLQAEIEERRQVEHALRQSEARFRDLVENVPVGLYRTDKANRLLDANPTFLRMLGFEGDEVPVGLDVREFLVEPQDLERENELVDHDGIVRGYELRVRRRDGSIFWVRDTFQ